MAVAPRRSLVQAAHRAGFVVATGPFAQARFDGMLVPRAEEGRLIAPNCNLLAIVVVELAEQVPALAAVGLVAIVVETVLEFVEDGWGSRTVYATKRRRQTVPEIDFGVSDCRCESYHVNSTGAYKWNGRLQSLVLRMYVRHLGLVDDDVSTRTVLSCVKNEHQRRVRGYPKSQDRKSGGKRSGGVLSIGMKRRSNWPFVVESGSGLCGLDD